MLVFNRPIVIFYRVFTLILVLFILAPKITISQSSPNLVSKRGGICFRTDDNQSIAKYLEYASIFNKYNQKFTFAVNLGLATITSDYLNGIRQMQASGHEMMDHTPKHTTTKFSTILDPEYFRNHPGVHKISKNKIDLNHAAVDIKYSKRSGYVNIQGNRVTSTSGIFSKFSKSDCYLYFPSLNQLVFINDTTGWIDSNNVEIHDYWNTNINLGSHQNIVFYNFDFNNIYLTPDALRALGEESVRLAIYYNLERPYTWIQPGGYHPQVHRAEVKNGIGIGSGFKAAGTYDASLKVFNEYNPVNDKQFGMNWGDFRDDTWNLEECKKLIADRIAKHNVVIGHSHFPHSDLLGGWSGFLDRTEKLIQWCIANNIPIRTYSEWADVLYNQLPNPEENIFPPLNVDLDANNIPDGFNKNDDGTLIRTDGVPSTNDYCYSIIKLGQICSITNLGGIEKGQNEFEIWTKGAPGNFIEVIFKVGTQNLIYKFPAEYSEWTKYNLAQSVNGNTSLNIPDSISLVDVTINSSIYSSGEVKISGMQLTKSNPPNPVELSSFTASINQSEVRLKWQTKTEVNNYGFEVERQKENREGVIGSWENIGFVPGYGNSNSPKDYSFIDKNPLGGTIFIYRLKQTDNDGKFKYSDQVEIKIIPNNYELYQNYPNPFNPSTKIRFALPIARKVSIQIYNQLGEIVAQPVNNFYESGNYEIEVNMANLASGVYFYKISAGAFSDIKKMILTK